MARRVTITAGGYGTASHGDGRAEASSAPPPLPSLGLAGRFGYGVGDLGNNVFWQAGNLFLLFFYTDVMGLNAGVAGSIYLAALIWDAVTDPVIGLLAERTRSRWGRYRPYLIFGAVPLALSFGLAFSVPALGGWALAAYALCTHLLLRTLLTVVSIPYIALSTRITQDSRERASLTGYRMVLAMVGAFLVSAAFLPLADALGGGEAAGFTRAALALGACGAGAILLCAALTREPPSVVSLRPTERPSIADIAGMLRENRPFLIVVGAMFLITASNTLFGGGLLYHFKYVLGAEGATPVGLVCLVGGAVVGAPVWALATARIGRRLTWFVGSAATAVGLCGLWLPTSASPLVFAFLFLLGFGAAAAGVVLWSALPDTVEYGEWRSGVRSESMLVGLTVFGQKLGVGVGTFALAQSLGLIGYVPDASQAPGTLTGLKVLVVAAPLGLLGLAVLLFSRYRLEAGEHDRIVGDLARAASDPA